MKRVYPLLVVAFVFAGFYKGDPRLSGLPVDLTLALAALVTVFALAVVWGRGVIPRGAFAPSWIFVVLLVPVLWTDFSQTYASEKFARFFTFTLLAFVAPVVFIRTVEEVRRFVWAIFTVCGFLTVVAIVAPHPVTSYAGAALTDSSGNTIGLGRAAGAVLVIGAAGLITRRLRLWLGISAILVANIVLLYSGSRGPLFSAVLSVLAVFVLRPQRPRKVIAVGALVVVVASLYLGFTTAPELAQSRIGSTVSGQLDRSAVTRLDLYRLAWNAAIGHPRGLGWGGFARVAPEPYRYPHDILLEVLVEDGWVAGILFLLWLAVAWRRARAAASGFEGSAVLGLVTFMALNAIVSGDVNDNRTLFLMIGIAFASSAVMRKGSSAAPPKTVAWEELERVGDAGVLERSS
jgi:O-antigen ligase